MRAKNPSLVVFGFSIQSYSTLHLLQNLFCRIKISCFKLNYTHLIRTIRKVKKSNKKFKICRAIIILRNHCFIILKLFQVIKGFILYQINKQR